MALVSTPLRSSPSCHGENSEAPVVTGAVASMLSTTLTGSSTERMTGGRLPHN